MSITSSDLQDLNTSSFAFLYNQSKLNLEVEKIIQLVLEEQYLRNSRILVYPLDYLPYQNDLIERLKTRLTVSSIYLINCSLYVDWSR